MIDEKFYSAKQIAEMLGVKKSTVYSWIRTGKLGVKNIAGRYRVTESQLKEFIG